MNIMVAQCGALENTAKVRIFLLFEPYFSIKKTVYVQKNKKTLGLCLRAMVGCSFDINPAVFFMNDDSRSFYSSSQTLK